MTQEDIHALSKSMIVELIQRETGLSLRDSKDYLEIVIEDIKAALVAGDDVKITGFGKWHVHDRPSHKGRNLLTGDPIVIEPRRKVKFKPTLKLRAIINGQKGETFIDHTGHTNSSKK